MEDQNKNSVLRNLKFIYHEICKFHNGQKDSINQINNKFSWIIAANIGIIGFIFISRKDFNDLYKFAFLLFIISLFFSVLSLWTRKYKRGPKLREMMKKRGWTEEEMVERTNEKMVEAVDENQKVISRLCLYLKISIIFLMIGVLVLFISIIDFDFKHMDFNSDTGNYSQIKSEDDNSKESEPKEENGFSDDSQEQEFGEGFQEVEKGNTSPKEGDSQNQE